MVYYFLYIECMRETLITAHTIDPLAGLLRVCSMFLILMFSAKRTLICYVFMQTFILPYSNV